MNAPAKIAARHGANLPPKDPTAGDHTSGNANEITRDAFKPTFPRARLDFINKGGQTHRLNQSPNDLPSDSTIHDFPDSRT